MEVTRRLDYAQSAFAGGRGETVVAPPIHEGIGNALKRVYFPRDAEIPSDFGRLLAQIR